MTRSKKRPARKRTATRAPRLGMVRDSDRIRPARVLAAQARIASGHYDRPEVRAYLLEALIQELRRH
jgi:hypothetical protein